MFYVRLGRGGSGGHGLRKHQQAPFKNHPRPQLLRQWTRSNRHKKPSPQPVWKRHSLRPRQAKARLLLLQPPRSPHNRRLRRLPLAPTARQRLPPPGLTRRRSSQPSLPLKFLLDQRQSQWLRRQVRRPPPLRPQSKPSRLHHRCQRPPRPQRKSRPSPHRLPPLRLPTHPRPRQHQHQHRSSVPRLHPIRTTRTDRDTVCCVIEVNTAPDSLARSLDGSACSRRSRPSSTGDDPLIQDDSGARPSSQGLRAPSASSSPN